VINQEADRRLLPAFINGLTGAPGRHVRMQMPDNIDKALNMALVATNAEKEGKAAI
jgi:trans-aconitate methyltransferase